MDMGTLVYCSCNTCDWHWERELVSAGAATKPSELKCACGDLVIFSSTLVLSCAPTRSHCHCLWVLGLHWTCFPCHSTHFWKAITTLEPLLKFSYENFIQDCCSSIFNAVPCPWCPSCALRIRHSLLYYHSTPPSLPRNPHFIPSLFRVACKLICIKLAAVYWTT